MAPAEKKAAPRKGAKAHAAKPGRARDRAAEMFAGFLAGLGGGAAEHAKVIELEKRYNTPLPGDLRRLLCAVLASGHGVGMREWRLGSDEIAPALGTENQFERIVELDQGNYLGTWMLELFTNSIYLGQLGNGDGYYAALKFKGVPADFRECEIAYFNHETYDLEFPFADSLPAMVAVNLLHDRLGNEEEFDRKALKSDMQALKDRLNLPWHFESLSEVTGVKPSFEGTIAQLSRFLMYRALWLVYLLRADGVHKLQNLPKAFQLVERKPIEDFDEWLSHVTPASPVSLTYWLWEFFFFQKNERLERALEAMKQLPSPLVQDCVRLISELHSGKRKRLGKIEDVQALRREFLALDLDPDRAGERAREAQARQERAARQQESDEVRARQLIAGADLGKLAEIAWDHLDSPVMVDAIFAHLRANDPSLRLDFERADFLSQQRSSRNNQLYRFEDEEVLEALFDEKTRLAPWLLLHGQQTFGRFPQAAGFIAGKLREQMPIRNLDSLQRFAYFRILPHLELPALENDFLSLLPTKLETGEIVEDMKAVSALAYLIPLLGRMKSAKLLERVSELIALYREKMQAPDSDQAARSRNNFYDKVGPAICKALRDVGGDASLEMLRALGRDDRLRPLVLEAQIELGDPEVLPALERLCARQHGLSAKVLPVKVAWAYALHKAGKTPDTGPAKEALGVILPKWQDSVSLFCRAIAIVAGHCAPDEARGLIRPFLEDEYTQVRRAARDALRALGESEDLIYLDRARVDLLYREKGRQALLDLLSNPWAVFRHNLLRKLADEKDTGGVAGPAIAYLRQLTRFDAYAHPYVQDKHQKTYYAIYALAQMEIRELDEFLLELMAHPNVMIRGNDLFAYKNYPHSEFLAKKMQMPPEPRPSPLAERPAGGPLAVTEMGVSTWMFGAAIHGIAHSPDGAYCAIVGPDKSAIYGADGRQIHGLIDRGHAYDVDYHPSGKMVAVGFHGGHLHLYGTQDGQLKGKLVGHQGVPSGVRKVRFSPDGKRLASVSDDKTLRIWNLDSQKSELMIEFSFDVNGVDWFPDGERVVVGTDKTVQVVDRKKKKVVAERDTGAIAEVRVFQAGDKIVIGAGGGPKGFLLLDETLKTLRVVAQAAVARLRFSKDGSAVFAASWDSKDAGVSRWELPGGPAGKKGKPTRTRLGGLETATFGLDLHPVSGEPFAGGNDRVVHHWTVAGEDSTPSSVAHKTEVTAIHSDGQNFLATLSKDGRVIRWSGPSAGEIVFAGEGVGLAEALTVSPDGKTLVIGASNKIVTVAPGGKTEVQTTKGRCEYLEFLPDSRLLAAVDGQFLLEDRASEPTQDRIYQAFVLPRQGRIASVPFLSGYITVWDFEKLCILQQVSIPVATHGVYCASLSRDQERLFVSCSDQVIRVYDTQSWEVVRELFHAYSVNRIALSPDDALLACAFSSQFELRRVADFALLSQAKLPGKISRMRFAGPDVVVCGFESGGLAQLRVQ